MIKAVFFDIDGTLVSFHTHRVSEATRQAIRQLRTQGIKVFIATGRHLQVINNLGDLEFDGYVTLNGSCCYIGRDRVIYRRMIPEIALEHLIKYQEEKETFPCIFVREKDMFINYNNQHTREVFRMLDFPEPVVKDIHEATREGVFQLIAFFSEQQEDRIMQALPECEATRWNPLFTDVVPVGGNKSIGMEKILAYFGISREETMAFGDGGNDIPMLEYAGIGVAMGNASEEVQRHAHRHFAVRVNALEVAVQNLGLVGVHLESTQNNELILTVELHREDGSVELFLLQVVIDFVVIERDKRSVNVVAVDNARHFVFATQAAARTRSLLFTQDSGEIHLS